MYESKLTSQGQELEKVKTDNKELSLQIQVQKDQILNFDTQVENLKAQNSHQVSTL